MKNYPTWITYKLKMASATVRVDSEAEHLKLVVRVSSQYRNYEWKFRPVKN